MRTLAEFLGAREHDEGTWEFAMGEDVHGAFGGVFGGAVAAACVLSARSRAPGRRPFSLHVTFVRALSSPTCVAATDVQGEGRTVTTVGVALSGDDERVAARATVTFASPDALSPQDHPGRMARPAITAYDDGKPLRMEGAGSPAIAGVLGARLVGQPEGGHAHAITLPWVAESAFSAEAVCMAADFCVGIPVGSALTEFVPIPNPDLSLRFTGDDEGRVLVGIGRLGRIDAGVAATQVEVWAGAEKGAAPDGDASGGPTLVGVGLSSAVLLGGGGGGAPRTSGS